jgi:hypothetical protein
MSSRITGRLAVLALVLAAGACSTANPAQPSSAGTASVGAPRPLTPANAAVVRNPEQPVVLVVQNGVSTKAGATYTFEVASDAGFATIVQTKDRVAEGSGGQTSVKLDPLAPAKAYYWHARVNAGGTAGIFSAAYKFTIGAAIDISAPRPVAPDADAATSGQPTFTVANSSHSPLAGRIYYQFDLSTTPSFGTIAVTGTVPEGSGQTSFAPPAELLGNTRYFWRATAVDPANGASSPPSAPRSFITSLVIDLSKVVYLKGPNISNWKQTGRIKAVEQDGSVAAGGPMCISFTDPGWPDAKWIYGGSDPNFGIFGNQWYFAKIGGVWYGGAGEWLYRGGGSCKAGQGTTTIGPDSGFGPPISHWVPKPGELVGFLVSASARALPAMATVKERTNVVLQPWHDSSLQGFSNQAIEFKR